MNKKIPNKPVMKENNELDKIIIPIRIKISLMYCGFLEYL
jgi:hypothetical protein